MSRARALLLLNRRSRRGREENGAALRVLSEGGIDLLRPTRGDGLSPLDHVRRHAREVDMVVVGGGDGSLNAVIEGLIETGLPLGILPLGTGNDLARTLGLPMDVGRAATVIVAGRTQRVDLGWVNGKHFFNAATIGLSVTAAQQLTGEVKRRWGLLGYSKTLVDAWKALHPFTAEIRCGTQTIRRDSVQIVVGNGRHHGAGMIVAADARIDDRRLDLYSLDPQSFWQVLRHLPALRLGHTRPDPPGIWRARGDTAVIVTSRRLRISADGEMATHTPGHFRVVPSAVEVFAPAPPGP
jgi:YegS/Rv2252/BmrU family lipid kinase